MKIKRKSPVIRPLMIIVVTLVVTGALFLVNFLQSKQPSIEERLELTALATKIFSVRNDRLPNDLTEVSSYDYDLDGLKDFGSLDISGIEFKPINRFEFVKKFALCTNFKSDTREDFYAKQKAVWENYGRMEGSGTLTLNNNYYQHPEGDHCFNEESVHTSHEYRNGNIELKLRPWKKL